MKYWTVFLVRTERAQRARSVLKKSEVQYLTLQTEQERSINCLLYGYSIFLVAEAILHRQRFDISPYCPKKLLNFYHMILYLNL